MKSLFLTILITGAALSALAQNSPFRGIAGGADGINGLLIINRQTGYTIIVLSNYDPSSAEKPGMRIRDRAKQIKE